MERTLRARIPHRWLLWALLVVMLSMCLGQLAFGIVFAVSMLCYPSILKWSAFPGNWSIANTFCSVALLMAAALLYCRGRVLRSGGRTALLVTALSCPFSLFYWLRAEFWQSISPKQSLLDALCLWDVLWWARHGLHVFLRPDSFSLCYEMAWPLFLLALLHGVIPVGYADRIRFRWMRADRRLAIILLPPAAACAGPRLLWPSLPIPGLDYITVDLISGLPCVGLMLVL